MSPHATTPLEVRPDPRHVIEQKLEVCADLSQLVRTLSAYVEDQSDVLDGRRFADEQAWIGLWRAVGFIHEEIDTRLREVREAAESLSTVRTTH